MIATFTREPSSTSVFLFYVKAFHDQPLNLTYLHLLSTVSLSSSGDRERHKPYRNRVFYYLVLVKRYITIPISNVKSIT